MISKILNRGFATKCKSIEKYLTILFLIVNPKFPSDTVAGMFKAAVSANYMFDSARFDHQRFNWNLKDFDRYSSAFAYGLVENGFAQGDKVLLWADQTNSAEILTAQMGAAKAGVSVVIFNEKNDKDAFHQALRDSGARGLIFSPSTAVNDNGDSRQTIL